MLGSARDCDPCSRALPTTSHAWTRLIPFLSSPRAGSPLRRITEDQAYALTESLRSKGLSDASVYVGMRYWHPYTEEAMEQVTG